MDNLDVLPLAAAGFERRLVAVTPDDLDRTTPCDGWTVRDLLTHVIAGTTMSAAVLRGASRDEAVAIVEATVLDEADLVAQFRAVNAEQTAAFADPASLERIVAHPAMDMPGAQLAGFRVGDLTVHTWDLARAIGADEQLDDDAVAVVWENIQPMLPMIGAVGVFGEGPSGTVADDAPLQARLLDAMGRRP